MTFDQSGRLIAPPQSEPAPRPSGPWDSNGRTPFTYQRNGRTFICSWHAGHDPLHPLNKANPNHGMCDACYLRMSDEGAR